MSIVAVKVLKNKIVKWSDQQVTYSMSEMKNDHNKPVKLHRCWDIVFWSCWSSWEANKMKMFLDSYEPKDINNERWIFSMIKQFKERWKDYELEDIENVYVFVCNWKVFSYEKWFCEQIEDNFAIWSWRVKAMIAMEFSNDMELILQAVCKHDLYCSEPLIIIEVEK